jgi:hypothetical protein
MCNTEREERIVTELKIYGDHDERTVSQMRRCMGVGSVAGGSMVGGDLDEAPRYRP